MDNRNLAEVFDGRLYTEPLEEIMQIALQVSPGIDKQMISDVHLEVTRYFHGTHPNFHKNTLPYHNLRHTLMVVLAATRLFHGLHCNGVKISADTLFKGLLAAYFHDTGMLLQETDETYAATDFLADHEIRSVLFLKHYCRENNFEEEVTADCATIINYTNLSLDPTKLRPHSQEIQMAGQVLGSADILAQMADRYYLECLPLLFAEQQNGGINIHKSALDLMAHTANFYHNVVLKRLLTTFSNTSRFMTFHFRERYMIDRNLYKENIDKNIAYLESIIDKCYNLDCLEDYLKRIPPVLE